MNREELQNIAASAKYKKERAEKMVKEAKKKTEEFRKLFLKFSTVHQKLSLFYSEIQTQIKFVNKIIENLKYQHKLLSNSVKEEYKRQYECINNLEKSLEFLKEKKIHTILQKSTGKDDLFGFVNFEQLNALIQKGEEKLKETKTLRNVNENLVVKVLDDFGVVLIKKQKLEENMEEIKKISASSFNHDMNSNLLYGLEKGYEIIRNFYGNTIKNLNVSNVNIFVEQSKKIDDSIEKMGKEILTIESNFLLVKSAYKKMHVFYQVARTCYDDLDVLTKKIPQKLREIEQLKSVLQQDSYNDQLLFEQISELSIWYTFFPIAYDNTLLEICRRRTVYKEHMKRYESIKKELDGLWIEEEEKRQKFFEEYGKFIPSNLLPSLVHTSPKFSITQHFKPNLPDIQLSCKEIEVIKMKSKKNEVVPSNVRIQKLISPSTPGLKRLDLNVNREKEKEI